jgi:2-C-methyl-D-erythritol 2,4-cyclodiphosphate synthase
MIGLVNAGAQLPRIGIGTDVHRLVDGAPMHLAGLFWPEEPQGLEGHY